MILEGKNPFKPNNYSLSNIDEQLKKFIPLYTKQSTKPWIIIAPKQLLRMGVSDKSVVLLRQRLSLTGDLPDTKQSNSPLFDKSLEKGISIFQERHGIISNGTVDKKTLAALNVRPEIRLKQLKVNMERWKNFKQKESTKYLWINIPDYHARLIENNKISLKERVIVGKPTNPTPELYSEITDVMLNPYWIVPQSIAQNNIIPQAVQNPDYMQQKNIHIFLSSNNQELELNDIDWSSLATTYSDYFFRQDPGPQNPLGKIKFKITNSDSIYLHDTCSKKLFDQDKRALSSGCVRMQNPMLLFSKLAKYNKSVRKKDTSVNTILKSGKTLNIKLDEPFPVYITYMTAWVGQDGLLNFRDDIYNRDAA
jgi:murein L,D-transpeptidase YcbB/YkuD